MSKEECFLKLADEMYMSSERANSCVEECIQTGISLVNSYITIFANKNKNDFQIQVH